MAITTFVKISSMIEFDQYLGFLAFLTILTIGFWLMIFLITFVIPYWLTGNLMQWIKERKAKKSTS
jgi:antibiotic biosynthesis monooxygenase (ABM) superfamily enzyme